MRSIKPFLVFLVTLCGSVNIAITEDVSWYTEGNYAPAIRFEINLVNTLNFDRINCPVIITREQMPIKNLHSLWVTVVDQELPPNPEPTKEELAFGGGHLLRGETNGHQIFRQLDDLDRDGIWDELFFMTDFKANETKKMYIYIGFSQRGWNEHGTHAAIGSYMRHIMPFWESEHIGWKLWYPTDCDMYGKRKGILMAHELYTKNLCGYNGIPKVNFDYGSDIQIVSDSFGAGGIGIFEVPSQPDSISRPRFTSAQVKKMSPATWNEGQINDTRYVFEVVANGPVRSTIRVRTLNWKTGAGTYELEQLYTAYSKQNYSICRVTYQKFFPDNLGTSFGCGIRKNPREYDSYQEGGAVITIGDDELSDPDNDTGQRNLHVDYVGNALIVKDKYNPEYQFVTARSGNHTFRIPVTDNYSFEYLIAGGWSDGAVLNTPEKFKEYVKKTAIEYNNPIEVYLGEIESKQE